MNTEELRAMIWDDLYRSKRTASIDHLAEQLREDPTSIRAAVEHAWFNLSDGHVSIAMAAPGSQYRPQQQSPEVHHG